MNFLPSEVIKTKRNGQILNDDEIREFILSYSRGLLPDYQMSALLMAIYFQGMSQQEMLALTKAMLHSGEVVNFSDSSTFKIDKHSTGGVGDKTSLILAPIVAACGIKVPMISGRGLAHTGGTLDKLESIPGFQTQKSLVEFVNLVNSHNLCFIGQTKEICPADKKIYALRDVTATVESLPLICASIMSKKLAEGIDGLVLDVKFGSGAFMKDIKQAEDLAIQLMSIAKGYNKKVCALLTNMNQPLGRYAGNALEVKECLEIMSGVEHPFYKDTTELSLSLAAHMIHMSGKCKGIEESYELAKTTLKSGAALNKFKEVVKVQGGDLTKLETAKFSLAVYPQKSGQVQDFNTEAIGITGQIIHAGRSVMSDVLDYTAGIEFHAKIGDQVSTEKPIFTLFGNDESLLSSAAPMLSSAVKISTNQANQTSSQSGDKSSSINTGAKNFKLIEKILN